MNGCKGFRNIRLAGVFCEGSGGRGAEQAYNLSFSLLKEVLVMVENKIDMSPLLFKEVFLLELSYGKLGILP